jgi:hypothetical protein
MRSTVDPKHFCQASAAMGPEQRDAWEKWMKVVGKDRSIHRLGVHELLII